MLNSKKYNFQFFLGGNEEVKSLEEGAFKNGGATQYKDKIISNIETNEFIDIKDRNEISIFIPSTLNVDEDIDNSIYVREIITKIADRYDINELSFYNTYGSWLNELTNTPVIEKITIVTLRTSKLTEIDLLFFIRLAQYLKNEMVQQGISLRINDSLAII